MGQQTIQESVDTFYFANGPCCAGCDWWRWLNSVAGECLRSRISPSRERVGLLGITGMSLNTGVGHAITPRAYYCGNFKDSFDWDSLPPHYLRQIGAPARRGPQNKNAPSRTAGAKSGAGGQPTLT